VDRIKSSETRFFDANQMLSVGKDLSYRKNKRYREDAMQSSYHNKALVIVSDEHAQLVDLMYELDDAIAAEPASSGKVAGILEKILDQTAKHFMHEEELMLDAGYAGFEEHRHAHLDILAAISDLLIRYRAKTAVSGTDIKDGIEQSMFVHIKKYDDGLVRFLSK
jgi:hemerythrin-like metal-binding protein